MNLKLSRPVAFFDLETTGVNTATDRVVEISVLRVSPDGSKANYTQRINPTIPIPAGASDVHGIYDHDVALMPTFELIAGELNDFMADCDLGGFNSNRFDVPLLVEEFLRTNVVFEIKSRKLIDAQTIFHKMEQRTLTAAYKFYCGKDLIGAHGAEADTNATFEVLDAQIARYEEIQGDTDFLHEFSQRGMGFADFAGRIAYDENGVEVFNFGKHKGKAVTDVFRAESGYYSWMMNSEFPLYTKQVLKGIWDKMRSEKPPAS